MSKSLEVKIRETKESWPHFGVTPSGEMYCLCWDNSETNRLWSARLDVTEADNDAAAGNAAADHGAADHGAAGNDDEIEDGADGEDAVAAGQADAVAGSKKAAKSEAPHAIVEEARMKMQGVVRNWLLETVGEKAVVKPGG